MGSMWLDQQEDNKIYYGPSGNDVPDFDPSKRTSAKAFPNDRWGTDFLSLQVMIDFMDTDWRKHIVIDDPPAPDSKEVSDALELLVTYQKTKRAAAMNEIIAQNSDFQPYFCAQLGISPRAYPHTYLMLKMAARIGELVMVHLKRIHRYARPSQMYPRLTPAMAVAPHASYPSGHALVGHMMAYTLNDIVDKIGDAPDVLARQIALNREIAGFHFPFDTEGGIRAAYLTMDIYRTLDFYLDHIDAAISEWDPNRV
jgi:acid phosphatase (class A)